MAIVDQDAQNYDPLLTQATSGPSPEQETAAAAQRDRGIRERIAKAEAAGPSVRQTTQSETIDLQLVQGHLGNPFSTRWIPFEQLREMTTDLMLAFGWWSTIGPIIRADFSVKCPDAQLAAAVDEAYRQVHTSIMMAMSSAMWYGHQPLVKQFKLGTLGATYRDPNGKNPNDDIPVWGASAQMLLWKAPAVLNPSHCLPMWDDDGQMIGFKFSNTPIPHYDLSGASSTYGYESIPGKVIDSDSAVWITNEKELNFGNVFGSPRTSRAYRYWFSYWLRWNLADRSYENLADPAKYVYYPVQFDEFIDQDDAQSESPLVRRARDTAIQTGQQIRSGATIAFPGSMAEGKDGNPSSTRNWEAGYFQAPNNFADLDATFKLLDVQKIRAWFIPEMSLIEGAGGRTSGGSAGGTGGSRMASQLADVHEESLQPLVDEYDEYVNTHWIPQFIAANYPEKIGTPCLKVTQGLGQASDSTMSQVLQLVGQVRGEVIPVDIRALLKQLNVPLLNQRQMESEIAEISKLAQMMGPPEAAPTPRGTQGYNAGVMKTPGGGFSYYQGPDRIDLSNSEPFATALPDTPHFADVKARSTTLKLRRVLLERYQEQYASFATFLGQQPTLHLADAQQTGQGAQPSGLSKKQAAVAAAAIVAAWAATKAPGAVGAPAVFAASGVGAALSALIVKSALDAGTGALKDSRLHAEDFDQAAVTPWAQQRVEFVVDSIDSTVRDEAQGWLTDELQKTVSPADVSAAAKEHFADFAGTHADRAARSEQTEGFNRGTLVALQSAGVAQVQAHDASDGTDKKTDQFCQQRNGRVYSVADALNVKRAHPACTLAWSPLATEKLSVVRVDKVPSNLTRGGGDEHVGYDSVKEILYLDDHVDDSVEQAVMLMLGSQLQLR